MFNFYLVFRRVDVGLAGVGVCQRGRRGVGALTCTCAS